MSRFEAVAAGLSGAGNIPISNRSIQHAVEGSVLNVGLEGGDQCRAAVRYSPIDGRLNTRPGHAPGLSFMG
jgi:hypothetical protein